REIIYGERRKILEGTDTRANFVSMVEHVVAQEVPTYCEGRNREGWDLEGLWERMRQFAPALPELQEINVESLGGTVDDVIHTLNDELIALYEEKEQEYGVELMRGVEQGVMLQVIDTRWRAYLTQMDHLREGIGLQAYGQNDPLIEYKKAAFESFQELVEDIQREIVRALLNVRVQRMEPGDEANGVGGGVPEPTEGAAQATAPEAPRADRPGSASNGADVPAARPASAAASGALARAAGVRATAPLAAQPTVRNVVESSSAGVRRADGAAAPAAVSNGQPRKVGRNQPCPCGSGKKYKFCHGR
ncbi:MAG TPA: SEC-C metal-binding domain-containing protein, partial [Dehalococcoidia bacterium]|nr:SEC-C metal-binding domain-containing protein [Dehalococcoidia bacterium]